MPSAEGLYKPLDGTDVRHPAYGDLSFSAYPYRSCPPSFPTTHLCVVGSLHLLRRRIVSEVQPSRSRRPLTVRPVDWADLAFVDLAKAKTPEGRAEQVRLARDATHRQGFFYVINHGLDKAVVRGK